MAVAVDEKKLATFEQLFAQPSVEGMLALSWQDFQDFVQYVFECAGYAVENVANQFFPNGPGVDLNLYANKIGGKPLARVEVKKYDPANLVDAGQVMAFIGKLQVAGGTPGYLVTTSGFGGPAKAAADGAQGKVQLLDSKRFLRYIAYVGGSRLAARGSLASTLGRVSARPSRSIRRSSWSARNWRDSARDHPGTRASWP